MQRSLWRCMLYRLVTCPSSVLKGTSLPKRPSCSLEGILTEHSIGHILLKPTQCAEKASIRAFFVQTHTSKENHSQLCTNHKVHPFCCQLDINFILTSKGSVSITRVNEKSNKLTAIISPSFQVEENAAA